MKVESKNYIIYFRYIYIINSAKSCHPKYFSTIWKKIPGYKIPINIQFENLSEENMMTLPHSEEHLF